MTLGGAIGSVLGNAVGVTISPLPSIALIMVLFSPSARRNGPVFMLGWFLGLAAVSALVVAVGIEAGSGSTALGGILKVVVGVVLLWLAVRRWRGRPRDGEATGLPGWMTSIADAGTGRVLGLGLLLSAANPKNLGLTVAAMSSTVTLPPGESFTVLAVFVVLASSVPLGILVYSLVGGDRAAASLTSLRGWLERNNDTVMTVLLLVLGTKVLGDGVAALL